METRGVVVELVKVVLNVVAVGGAPLALADNPPWPKPPLSVVTAVVVVVGLVVVEKVVRARPAQEAGPSGRLPTSQENAGGQPQALDVWAPDGMR